MVPHSLLTITFLGTKTIGKLVIQKIGINLTNYFIVTMSPLILRIHPNKFKLIFKAMDGLTMTLR
jgi:hypothetical protein